MYAIRVEKFVDTTSSGHVRVKRISLFNRIFALFSQKEDASVLGAALRSDVMMNMYFGDIKKSKTIDSISKSLILRILLNRYISFLH